MPILKRSVSEMYMGVERGCAEKRRRDEDACGAGKALFSTSFSISPHPTLNMLLCERYIGLMSGTSCDGVDAVLADFAGGRVETVGHVHVPFSEALREQLQALMQSGHDEIERMGEASVALARVYSEATKALLSKTNLAASDIAALGAHGQTVRHRPERGFTLQINQPALLAELTGIAVVADFRSRDVAAGGQGAPLVPAFHAAVFSSDKPRAVVNIGGIANVSLLPSREAALGLENHPRPGVARSSLGSYSSENHPHPGFARPRLEGEVAQMAPLEGEGTNCVRGFDTGPGNTLLDGWCARHTGKPFDESGAWGATGKVNEHLLAALFDEPYFKQNPPKSTGRELFNLRWLDEKLKQFASVTPTHSSSVNRAELDPCDVQATLVALTAQSIAREVRGREVYVCGGGAFNAELMRQIPGARSTAELGVDPMQVEALAFAWLARACFAAHPGNVPSVTGARGGRILGAVYPK